MPIHPRTRDIFEWLSKGQFISSNSVVEEERRLYTIIDEEFDQLYDYYSPIGYYLERGNEYFFFARQEAKADIERKIEQAYRWIDVVDFFKAFDSGFGVGYRFRPYDVLSQLNVDANLKDKLEQLKKPFSEGKHQERVQRLIEELEKNGFVALEEELTQQYKVLSAYQYIEQLLLRIQITEEASYAVPE
ncbi:MAG: hypothetical protein EOO15_04460 [Chitinophagaceae bacterium]|nr:MAG: hypothetical protein EOO15_04460 [Chitinophagaceae bacterium]